MSASKIRFETAPLVSRERRFAELLSPKTTSGIAVYLTGEQITGCSTHYVERRPRPCIGNHCWMCKAGHSLRWKGYISAIEEKKRTHGLMEVTEYAAEQVLALSERQTGLRGLALRFRRYTSHPQAKVIVEKYPLEFPGILPAGFDPAPVLLRLWRILVPFQRLAAGETLDILQAELPLVGQQNVEGELP